MDAQNSQLDIREAGLQEQFAGQIKDTSLPAQEVLTEQQATVVSERFIPLFVP